MSRPSIYYAIFGLIVAAHVALLWSTLFVPLTDVPITLTNAYILHHYHDSTLFASLYRIQYVPIPNIGFHLFLTPLLSWVSPETSLKLFLTFLVIVFALGADRLSTAFHHGLSWRAPLMLSLLYSSAFYWGLLNYLLGVAFFFIAYSAWLQWRARGWTAARAIAIVALATLCYLTHLSSFGFLMLSIVVTIVIERWKGVPLSLSKVATDILLPLVVPMALFLVFMTHSGSVGKALEVNDLRGKLAYIAAFFHTIRHETLLAFASAAVALVMSALVLSRHKRVDLLPSSLATAFLLLFAVSPLELFTSSLADLRFLLPGICFLIVSISGRLSRTAFIVIASAGAVLIGTRLIEIAVEWHEYDARIRTEVSQILRYPRGTRLFGLFVQDRLDIADERPLANTMTYGLLYRGLHVAPLLAMSEQSIVALKDSSAVAHLSDDRNPLHTRLHSDKPYNAAAMNAILQSSDIIWAYRPPAAYKRALDSACRYDTSFDGLLVYRVNR